jgi:hypothetical protein
MTFAAHLIFEIIGNPDLYSPDRDFVTIARRFNAGIESLRVRVPEGRLEAQPSLWDFLV